MIKDLFGIIVICECECDKSCDIGEYLDYENCKCIKRLIDKLVKKCSQNIDENENIYNDYINVCNSCTIYIVLFGIAFLIIIGISSACIYSLCYLKKSNTGVININPATEELTYETYK